MVQGGSRFCHCIDHQSTHSPLFFTSSISEFSLQYKRRLLITPIQCIVVTIVVNIVINVHYFFLKVIKTNHSLKNALLSKMNLKLKRGH